MTTLEKAAHALAMKHYMARFPAGPEEHWRNNADMNRHLFDEQARVVLLAIRSELPPSWYDRVDIHVVRSSGPALAGWQAMLDAILQEASK